MDILDITKRKQARFSGIKTFFRLNHEKVAETSSNVLLCGIPFDGGSTYRTGSRMAPSSMREISALGRAYHPNYNQNVFEILKPVDIGDLTINPISLKKTYQLIEKNLLKIAQNKKRVLCVGGDHSITLPILRALSKIYGPLNLIHFDAHFDTYPPAYGDEEYHHGTFVRHAVLENCVREVFQFGIRGPWTAKEDQDFIKKHEIKVWTVDDIKKKGKKLFKEIPALKGASYLSFDVDCLDPAYAPGTGTPMPAGLNSYEAFQILRNLKIEKLIGGDVVEVNPSYDHGQITSLVATSILFEILNLMV
ncbi:MAG: agmatinase [Bdellovibrionales bacterium]|nr:agmatinase [Bdellovibrionales bacterium]